MRVSVLARCRYRASYCWEHRPQNDEKGECRKQGAHRGSFSAAIFVAAITDEVVQIARPDEHRLNALMILGSKRELEHTSVVRTMVGNAEPYPYDDPSHRRTIENVAHRHIGQADPVLSSNLLQHLEQLLEQRPATPGVNHLFILPQAGRIQGGTPWLRLPEVGIG